MEGNLYTHASNGIGTVEFGHPRSNSLNTELLERMTRAFESFDTDERVKVIVLKSEGNRAFCAGASLEEMIRLENEEQGKRFFQGFGKLIHAMIRCRKPVIGRIQGKAVGGAVGIVAACDYAMATEYASVKLSELSIGIGPFVVEPVIRHKTGVSAVTRMAFNPDRWFSAYEAKEMGLFGRVFESAEELDEEVNLLAGKWATYSAAALEELKKICWEGMENYGEILEKRAAVSGTLALSETTKDILRKFKK